MRTLANDTSSTSTFNNKRRWFYLRQRKNRRITYFRWRMYHYNLSVARNSSRRMHTTRLQDNTMFWLVPKKYPYVAKFVINLMPLTINSFTNWKLVCCKIGAADRADRYRLFSVIKLRVDIEAKISNLVWVGRSTCSWPHYPNLIEGIRPCGAILIIFTNHNLS